MKLVFLILFNRRFRVYLRATLNYAFKKADERSTDAGQVMLFKQYYGNLVSGKGGV